MRLKFEENQVACPKCGFTRSDHKTAVTVNVGNITTQEQSALRILDGENTTQALPTINIDCPK